MTFLRLPRFKKFTRVHCVHWPSSGNFAALCLWLRVWGIVFLVGTSQAHARGLTVAAAASLKPPLEAIGEDYRSAHPNDTLTFVYGSSTKLRTQIENSAPFDVFLSAERKVLDHLVSRGLSGSPTPLMFAQGRLVLWLPLISAAPAEASKSQSPSTVETLAESSAKATAAFQELLKPDIKRIALANPSLAPYGAAAVAALQGSDLWKTLEPKAVYGQDVAQAAHFAASGNAQAAFVALSLTKGPDFPKKGRLVVIPKERHPPIEHGVIVTKRGTSQAAATRFAQWMFTTRAQARLREFGFEPVPAAPPKAP